MRTDLAFVLVAILLAGCAVGPRYVRPSASVPESFKEASAPGANAADWKPAEPKDAASRGKWWRVFGDSQLDALEEQIDLTSQQLARAAATLQVARAVARGAKGALLPTVSGGATVSVSHGNARGATTVGQATTGAGAAGTTPSGTTTLYEIPFQLSWEADLFGRMRRSIEANVANAQASAADLAALRLTIEAELAVDWWELRGLDAQLQLLDDVVDGYAKALELTRNRHDQGIVSGVDVAQAETQLETARVQATDLLVTRARLEHAIAMLVGQPPAALAIARSPLASSPPLVPLELPSELLERRPDIAAAERRVAAANAQIGVATAPFFPRVLLTAQGGLSASKIASLFTSPSSFWSLVPSLTETIFSGGQRRTAVQQARAGRDEAIASYRQTVLVALQEVEDGLSTSRILAQEAEQQAVAVAAAERLRDLSRTRYEGGITTFLEVVTAENAALGNERAAVDLLARRMVAAVDLVRALGGGWQIQDLAAAFSAPPAAPADTQR